MQLRTPTAVARPQGVWATDRDGDTEAFADGTGFAVSVGRSRSQLSEPDAVTYLEDRRARGVNNAAGDDDWVLVLSAP